MFAGVPSVVSDFGGMKELINASGGGKVVPARDVRALSAALTAYIHVPALSRIEGQKAEKYALGHLTAEEMARSTVEVYRQWQ
jgi:glycosyltransferase involved in cell wall biosynthesis